MTNSSQYGSRAVLIAGSLIVNGPIRMAGFRPYLSLSQGERDSRSADELLVGRLGRCLDGLRSILLECAGVIIHDSAGETPFDVAKYVAGKRLARRNDEQSFADAITRCAARTA